MTQDAPHASDAWASATGDPPPAGTFLSSGPAKKAIHWPSGEKIGS